MKWKTTLCLEKKTNISVDAYRWGVRDKVYVTVGCESPMNIDDCEFREDDKDGWCVHHKYQSDFRRCTNDLLERAMREEYLIVEKMEDI